MSSRGEKKAAKPVEPQQWWEDVTPDMARTYLKSNTHNRPLDAARVSKYAADMRAGRWLVSPETISFDEHGVLLNGQHRLGAIVESGVTVKMLIVMGMSPESLLIIDRGKPRTTAQNVGLMGKKNPKYVTAWANAAKFTLTGTQAAPFVEAEIIRLYDELEPAIDFAVLCGKSAVSRGPVGAAVLIAYGKNPVEVSKFFKAFNEGANLQPGSALLAAYKFYFQGAAVKSDTRPDITLKFLRCIQAHLEGEPLNSSHVYANASVLDYYADAHPPETIFEQLFKARQERGK